MKYRIGVMLVALLAAGAPFIVTTAAQADVSPASLTMQSQPGDFFGQGQDFSYSRPQDQVFANAGFNDATIFATVNGLNGDRWTLEFQAPNQQPLTTGLYANAQGAPFEQAGSPGIQVNEGFTCFMITGQFDVLAIQFTNGALSFLDVTFQEFCNGSAAGLSGELVYTPLSPPLPAQALTVSVNRTATLDTTNQVIEASGTVTCTQFDWTTVNVSFQQKGVNFATEFLNVSCSPGTPAAWTAFASYSQFDNFRLGASQASAFAFATDANDGTIADSPTLNETVALIPSPS